MRRGAFFSTKEASAEPSPSVRRPDRQSIKPDRRRQIELGAWLVPQKHAPGGDPQVFQWAPKPNLDHLDLGGLLSVEGEAAERQRIVARREGIHSEDLPSLQPNPQRRAQLLARRRRERHHLLARQQGTREGDQRRTRAPEDERHLGTICRPGPGDSSAGVTARSRVSLSDPGAVFVARTDRGPPLRPIPVHRRRHSRGPSSTSGPSAAPPRSRQSWHR